MGRALSVPQVTINNENFRIVPNSLVYDGGEGEINVRAASGGGNNIESIHTVNAETKISKVMFDVYLTAELDANIARWKEQVGTNSVGFSERLGNGELVPRSFDNMSLTPSIERNASADGVTSLEFMGDPMTQQ